MKRIQIVVMLFALSVLARPGVRLPDFLDFDNEVRPIETEKQDSKLPLNLFLDEEESVEYRHIGVLLPLSGKFERYGYGQRVLSAIRMALDLPEIPLKQLPINIQSSQEVTLFIADTKGNPALAERLVAELVNQHHVVAILGDIISESGLAAAKKAQALEVPIVSLSRSTNLPKIGEYVFRLGLSPEKIGAAVASKGADELKLKRFGVLYPDNPFGRESINEFEFELTKRGANIVSRVAYDPNLVDFMGVVKELLQKKSGKDPPFDAIYLPDEPKRIKYIVPALRAHDVLVSFNKQMIENYRTTHELPNARPVQLLGPSTWVDATLGETLGTSLDGSMFCDGIDWNTKDLNFQEFVKGFTKRNKSAPRLLEINAYDAAKILKIVSSSVRLFPNRRLELANRLKSPEGFLGLSGVHHFDSNGESKDPVVWFSFKDGKLLPKVASLENVEQEQKKGPRKDDGASDH